MKYLLLILLTFSYLKAFDYNLNPLKLNQNSYYFYGKEEYFSPLNGGDIANTSFIITKNSVILIDTGSSHEYGLQLKKAIEKITSKPIKYIINTHHHPDHFLGNSAFSQSDIFATSYTKEEIEKNGDLYIVNLVNIVQSAMKDTKTKAPNKELNSKILDFDDYKLEVLYLDGHTKSDVALFDLQSKILYSADLVFFKPTPATAHADIQKWIRSLEKLQKIDYSILVTGHGVATSSKEPIKENISYLKFLDETLRQSAKKGLDIFEILENPIPKEFESFTMFKEEFERSIINLYPSYEQKYE